VGGWRWCARWPAAEVGKSQLAAAVARQQIAEGCPLIGWVNAETTGQLMTGLAEIADRCGVADPEGDSAASARRLREHLSTGGAQGLSGRDRRRRIRHRHGPGDRLPDLRGDLGEPVT
jgi:hypothetical protein